MSKQDDIEEDREQEDVGPVTLVPRASTIMLMILAVVGCVVWLNVRQVPTESAPGADINISQGDQGSGEEYTRRHSQNNDSYTTDAPPTDTRTTPSSSPTDQDDPKKETGGKAVPQQDEPQQPPVQQYPNQEYVPQPQQNYNSRESGSQNQQDNPAPPPSRQQQNSPEPNRNNAPAQPEQNSLQKWWNGVFGGPQEDQYKAPAP